MVLSEFAGFIKCDLKLLATEEVAIDCTDEIKSLYIGYFNTRKRNLRKSLSKMDTTHLGTFVKTVRLGTQCKIYYVKSVRLGTPCKLNHYKSPLNCYSNLKY